MLWHCAPEEENAMRDLAGLTLVKSAIGLSGAVMGVYRFGR